MFVDWSANKASKLTRLGCGLLSPFQIGLKPDRTIPGGSVYEANASIRLLWPDHRLVYPAAHVSG